VEVVTSLSQGRTAVAQCGLFTYKSVPVIFEPPCMLHYDPQHVSSSTLLILRKTNCITTASGIVTLDIGEPSYINKMGSAVFTSLLFYLNIILTIQQTTFY